MGVELKKKFMKMEMRRKHECSGYCAVCTKKEILIDKMYDANIPVGYWNTSMKKFIGNEKSKEVVSNYIENIKHNFINGKSICFAGNQGTGKTMSSICILKSAIKNGFSCYYTSASDILSDMTKYETSGDLKTKLKEVDFLVIDEVDSRFFTSDSVKELFSSIYENIFRFRAHNYLPTIICTNETSNLLDVFRGQGVQAIKSLNDQHMTIIPFIGKDFRKNV